MKKDNIYSCSEEDLYAIAELAWQNCEDLLSAFQSLKAKYTPAYITATVAAIKTAKELPNADARRATSSNKRIRLVGAAAEAGLVWQSLSNYIGDSFPASEVGTMRSLAGSRYYHHVHGKDWQGISTLLTMASEFTAKYSAALIDGGMPESFTTEFGNKKTAYDTALKVFSDYKTDMQKEGDAKVAANNAVYTALMSMLKDATNVFASQPKTKKLFTFAELKRLVGKKSRGGYRITVIEEGTAVPVTTATILFKPGNTEVAVNKAGVAEVYLAKGVYSAVITTPGYNIVIIDGLQVDAGIIHRKEVQISKAAAVA